MKDKIKANWIYPWLMGRAYPWICCGVILLQRFPLLRQSAEAQFSMFNRVIKWMPYTITAVSMTGGYQALSGASGDLIAGDGEGLQIETEVGASFEWFFRVNQDGSGMRARGYEFESDAPPGVMIETAGAGAINQGKIFGTPTEAGTWDVMVHLYEVVGLRQNKISETPVTIIVSESSQGGNELETYFGPTLTKRDDGWANTPWFGWFYADEFPYVFHLEHRWLYLNVPGNEGGSMWMFDDKLGWLWTNQQFYTKGNKFFYSPSRGNWLQYFSDFFDSNVGDRWFYDFSVPDWLVIEAD